MKPGYTPGKKSLSEFGIGMKAASVWFGRKWVLNSYPRYPEQGAFNLEFDLDELLKDRATQVILNDIDVNSEAQGVKIVLSKLNRSISRYQASKIWNNLEEIYQLFTSRANPILLLSMQHIDNTEDLKKKTFKKKDFSNLLVANKPLEFPLCRFKNTKLYVIGANVKWKKDIQFEFEGKPVSGFISLGIESSQTSNPGIRLFRYQRLIKGSETEPYRPKGLVGSANKAAPSRFYAELHLDGQAISNSKGDFTFDEELFLETLQEQDGVLDFIAQAENFRQKKVDGDEYTALKDLSEYEALVGKKESNPQKKRSTPRSRGKFNESKDIKASSSIIALEKQVAPVSFLLLGTFITEAVQLYNEDRRWPFILAYRVILEVGIIQKLKIVSDEDYAKARDKSIVSLYKYLQSNSQLIPDSYETLKRVLKSNNNNDEPFVGLLNLSSHGKYIPTQSEVDDLLKNTQQLLEWAFDYEGE